MGEQVQELFRTALGLAEPWTVAEAGFSEGEGRLSIRLDFPAGSRFPCPECGAARGVYDASERKWRHLNFFQHETVLLARLPRVECPEHGVKTAEVPWARGGAGFTLLMEAYILALVQGGTTPAQAGRLVGEHDTRLWRVVLHYAEKGREAQDVSGVAAVGIDETSRSRGHNYVTVFMDLNPLDRRVLFAAEGKDAGTVGRFRADLEARGGDPGQVAEACMDMSAAFAKGVSEQFPGASLTFDNFHLVQLLTDAVDEVRRAEQRERPELKGTRYVWLKNEWNWTEAQREAFERLRSSNLGTVRAMHLKNVFQDIFACSGAAEAEPLLKRWHFWATHSRLAPMAKAAKTIKRHWDGVLRWFDSRISNGAVEAVNGLIQAAKRRARGFRTETNLIAMICLIAGKLDFGLPAFGGVTHTK